MGESRWDHSFYELLRFFKYNVMLSHLLPSPLLPPFLSLSLSLSQKTARLLDSSTPVSAARHEVGVLFQVGPPLLLAVTVTNSNKQ